MIRPSALSTAEKCGLAPALSALHPETSPPADDGTAEHNAVAEALRTGEPASTPRARAVAEWVAARYQGQRVLHVERHVSLVDVETIAVITEGTPDLVAESGELVEVVDYKFGQLDSVPEPDDNLQLHAYCLAVCEGRPYRGIIVNPDEDGEHLDVRTSRIYLPGEQVATLARVKRASQREPVACPGDHCVTCYPRRYCEAWRVRVSEGTALMLAGQQVELTAETAGALHVRIKAVEGAVEMAKAALKAYALAGGNVVVDGKRLVYHMRKGRESASVDELRAAGLEKYIHRGAPYPHPSWKKIPAA